jgi:hypothetical protein
MIIKMILSALLPEGAGATTGWLATGGTAAAPQDVQNCLSGDTSDPHFAQKLATMFSFSLGIGATCKIQIGVQEASAHDFSRAVSALK